MGFTNKRSKRSVAFSVPQHVVANVSHTVTEDVDGVTVERQVYVPVDLSSKEAASSIPTMEEYSLKNLLAAGVPLEQLQVSTLLNPTDVAFGALRAEAVLTPILDKLESSASSVESSNE